MTDNFYEAAVYDEENATEAYISTVIRDIPSYLKQHERNRQAVEDFQKLVNTDLEALLE